MRSLRRLANPFWFQALGCVMGMDWHSSGITTSVLGALKRDWPRYNGSWVCMSAGDAVAHSRHTPAELLALGERVSVDAPALVRASRLVAKVDSAAVQDGFALYLHGFVVTDDGKWTVVQQGMNPDRRQARRYHWLWERRGHLSTRPHTAIEGIPQGSIVNFTDRQAAAARARDGGAGQRLPRGRGDRSGARRKARAAGSSPTVREKDVDLRRLAAALTVAAERGPADFPELLLTPGIGGRTPLSPYPWWPEVVYGAPSPILRSGALFLCPWWQGRTPIPGSANHLR